MSLTKVVLTVVLVLLSAAWAQTRVRSANALNPPIPTPTSCPRVTVSCPDVLKPGVPVTFTANVEGGDPYVTPTFLWKVSAGEMTNGQGTSELTVDMSNAAGRWLTATVDVGGYERACPMSASCTLSPGDPPVSRKVDEYGAITVGDEKARLDNFTVEMQNDPTSQGYLICYGGRRDSRRTARRRCERAKNFLVVSRGVGPTRVVALDGGYREALTVEAWVVPTGAAPPTPTPTVFPRARGRR